MVDREFWIDLFFVEVVGVDFIIGCEVDLGWGIGIVVLRVFVFDFYS